VCAAHERNDGRAAARAAEIVVRGKEVPWDDFPKRRAADFERVCGAIRQRHFPREPMIDIGKLGQCTHGSPDRHRPTARSYNPKNGAKSGAVGLR
jgi:hypothetical protein